MRPAGTKDSNMGRTSSPAKRISQDNAFSREGRSLFSAIRERRFTFHDGLEPIEVVDELAKPARAAPVRYEGEARKSRKLGLIELFGQMTA